MQAFALIPLILALQALLFVLYSVHGQLPEVDYFSTFLAPRALAKPVFLVLLTMNIVVMGLHRKELRWTEVDRSGSVRGFVLIVVAVLGWYSASYDYNLFYDQPHYLDRALIVVLAAAVWFHPGAVAPFVMFAFVVVSQLSYPLPESAWDWPDKRILFDELVLFNGALLVGVVSRASLRLFPFLALTLTGSLYFYAAVAKLSLGPAFTSWLQWDSISYLTVAGYLQSGWLAFLDPDRIARLVGASGILDRPLALITLSLELSGILVAVGKRLSRGLLYGYVVLQAAIAAASGIFFWKWCLHNTALAWVVGRTDPWQAFKPRQALGVMLSAIVILCAPLYFRPVHFGWFDTRFDNFFTYEVEAENGTTYELDPRFFSPYDIRFVQSRFYYLVHDRVLVGTYGTTQDFKIMRALEEASPRDVPRLKADLGTSYYDAARVRAFAEFIARFIGNAQRRGTKFIALNYLGPPYHFRGASRGRSFTLQGRATAVRVYFEEHLAMPDGIVTVQKREVLYVPIGEPSGSPVISH